MYTNQVNYLEVCMYQSEIRMNKTIGISPNDHALIATPKSGGAAENFRLVRPPYQGRQNPPLSCSIKQNPGKTAVLPVLPTTALVQMIQENMQILYN
jgi:hypothetical protein